MRQKGRNTKLTKKMIKQIDEYLSSGCTQKMAATLVGISTATFHNYLDRANDLLDEGREKYTKEEELYIEFLEAVEGGIAEAHRKAVSAWMGAMDHMRDDEGNIIRFADWRAAESWLKRRLPEDFGEISRSEVNQKTVLEGAQTTGVMVVPTSGVANDDFAKMLLDSQNETHAKAQQLVDE